MDDLTKYLLDHSKGRDPLLEWLERETHFRSVHPRMLSGEPMGSFLTMIVKMIRPRNILEIGTFTGYSAICMARGLDLTSGIDTIEINDEQRDLIREAFRRSGLRDRIVLHQGDALKIIPRMQRKGLRFQLVYIDGNKREYVDYYRLVKPMVDPGGYIIADNVLWDGKVWDKENRDAQTQGIRAYNRLVADDQDVSVVLLPLGDGLSICRKDGPSAGNPNG
ncbi:MAG: O-methyltransferase [Bacteroidales bacterium]|jgi:caffeoyl-CoA O-methyltransferase|nr:O-methyltransferase [Bacteroidales bacterium]MDD2264352.1 O-methyltransferase [Bacteroidales bacterium]MDD2831586.1 O-methyltransferase [Bacteroidales bacterium]MDD3209453.1 O-methyltransferase [Bacteroidales bacterium]MDD3697564.1 O-methyltransferase [Bacteroidales bacterium]